MRSLASVLVVLLGGAGCVAELFDGNEGSRGQEVISDAVHNGGTPGFYFLPPLVAATPLPGPFDATRTLVARLENPSGTLVGAVNLALGDNLYHGMLDSEVLGLEPGVEYRARVMDGSTELGFADVSVYPNQQMAKSHASDEYFELVDGKKLHLKVYVQELDEPPAPTFGAPTDAHLYYLLTPDAVPGPQTLAALKLGASSTLVGPQATYATAGNARQMASEIAMAVSPNEQVLFVGHNESGLIQSFRTKTDGTVEPGDVDVVDDNPISIVVHPTLPYVFVVDMFRPQATLRTFQYGNDGQLALVHALNVDSEVRQIAMHPSGNYLAAAIMFGTPGVQSFSIGSNGALTSVGRTVFGLGSRPHDVVFDRTGTAMYVADVDAGIFGFDFDASTGGYSSINGGLPYPAGNFVYDFVASPTENALIVFASPAETFIDDTRIMRFHINPDHTLTNLGEVMVPDALMNATIARDGRTLAASSRNYAHVRTFGVAPLSFSVTEATGSPFATPAAADTTPSNLLFAGGAP